MSLILTTIVSFLVSLTTCLVCFWIGKKKSAKKTIQKVAPLRESEPEEKNIYEDDSNVPIKDYTFDNYFTDDPTFIEKMKSMLDNFSATNPVIILPIVIPQKKREEKDAALDSNSPPDTMYVAFHTIIVFSKAQ